MPQAGLCGGGREGNGRGRKVGGEPAKAVAVGGLLSLTAPLVLLCTAPDEQ
jgi:hypothetical protein